MNFVRATGAQGRKIAPEKRIYATLAVSGEALINTEELLRFLNQLIVLESPPDGFYVLVAAGNAEARADLFNVEMIAGWMFLNHAVIPICQIRTIGATKRNSRQQRSTF